MKKTEALSRFCALGIIAGVLMALGVASYAGDDKEDTKIPLSNVPQIVKDAVTKAIKGVDLKKARIEKETEKGIVIYEFKGIISGKKYEVEVDEKGNLIELKRGKDKPENGKDEKDGEEDDD
jgi:hypothetical protein